MNRAAVALGVLQMAQKAQDLDEALVPARAMRTSSKGDTVVYNSGAFKVTQQTLRPKTCSQRCRASVCRTVR
ncbi:MAG: hypothetical protein ACLR8Y_19490 [Alistipes indistinctus]